MAGVASAVVIRDANLDDAELLSAFNIEIARESENLTLDPDTILQGVTALLADPSKGRYFCAAVGGQVVGQTMITYEWSDWNNAQIWWIQSVYVKPEFRKQGIFSALYNNIAALAKADGVCGLRLYADVGNERAHKAYERLGMTSHYKVYEDMWVVGGRAVE